MAFAASLAGPRIGIQHDIGLEPVASVVVGVGSKLSNFTTVCALDLDLIYMGHIKTTSSKL